MALCMPSTAASSRARSRAGSSATIWRIVTRGWCITTRPIASPSLSFRPSRRSGSSATDSSAAPGGPNRLSLAASSARTIAMVWSASTSSSSYSRKERFCTTRTPSTRPPRRTGTPMSEWKLSSPVSGL